jgi:hypothetical protein
MDGKAGRAFLTIIRAFNRLASCGDVAQSSSSGACLLSRP